MSKLRTPAEIDAALQQSKNIGKLFELNLTAPEVKAWIAIKKHERGTEGAALMSKHPLMTKVKKPSGAKAKEFMRVELEAFEKSHPKPDHKMYVDDPEAYESGLAEFWKAWSEHTLTPEFQDRIPRSAIGLVQDKFTALAERIGIAPDSDQFWNLWDELKGLKGFQVSGGKGSGSRNTLSDTWRIDMFKMSVVADYMHRKGVTQTTALKRIEIDKALLKSQKITATDLSNIKKKYKLNGLPSFWEVLMDGREANEHEQGAIKDGLRPDGKPRWKLEGKTAAANSRKHFTEMMEQTAPKTV